ncbi:MAG: DUF3943 domain-containing protein [Barnesiella sp.]|nr:DUF3943 domain-containing protein [Barnesiella sp.]
MKLSRKFILALFAIIATTTVSAQRPIRLEVTPHQLPDSFDLSYYGKKDPWLAGGEVFGFNMGVWAIDRFIQKAEYAYINGHTIRNNFRRGFVWDNDQMGTNMFLHPYHGNLYFNSARSNGYNFWQSGLFALGGSAMWEFFMENEYPSLNDIIATPVGGMAIGELTYRASDIVLKDNSTGWERFGREAAAFVIAPTRGLTRIINGDAWRKRPTTGRQFGIPNVAIEFSAGIRMLQLKDRLIDEGAGGAFQFNLEYGDRFEVESSPRPYDYFSFNAELNVHKSQPVLGQLNIVGRLLSKELLDNYATSMSIGMYQHFDYYDSDTISKVSSVTPYKLGVPASVGAGLMFRDVQRGRFAMDAFLHANGIGLGAILSDYYRVDQRNYNLAAGYSIKGGANLVLNHDFLSLAASYEYYRLFTWDGYPRDIDWETVNPHTLDAQGDRSVAGFGVFSGRADIKVWRKLYATVHFTHYRRATHYHFHPTVHSSTYALRFMLSYKL